MNYLIVFVISFVMVSLELFFTRMLYLKAWNHVVYLVIPFAILGCGIGANLCMIFRRGVSRFRETTVLGFMCFLIAAAIFLSAVLMIKLEIRIDDLLNIFTNAGSLWALVWAYTVYMVPFVFIGFLIVYIFSNHPKDVYRLYCVDLIGAGCAAVMFFFLIGHFAVFRSVVIMAYVSLALAALVIFNRKRIYVAVIFTVVFVAGLPFVPEPADYSVDERKGWEYIPGHFPADTYQQILSRWHPLGRTDVYRITDEVLREELAQGARATFQINLNPLPEFAYFSTNFLAGTPVYKMSEEGLAEKQSKIALFSQSMEVPYVLLNKPKVLVIGAGGGRDIFMAKSHGAAEIIGAEINSAIVAEMSPGGRLYDYSGRIYTSDQTRVHVADGRHLIKKTPADSLDLIILNGVDTFSGLSSGAYAYAESYLYTKDAFKDYLRVLKDDGIINLNRWIFLDMPRESLRLHAIALQALKEFGVQKPWEHIIIGATKEDSWSIILVKKTPFTSEQTEKVLQYFRDHNAWQIYPASDELKANPEPVLNFQGYADSFQRNKHKFFAYQYPYDISVITDDNPFFYKYYKLGAFNPFKRIEHRHNTSPVIFLTQLVVFVQALVFIFIFIFFPLFVFRKNDIVSFPKQAIGPFLVYFGCLGVGYMFFEISSMQRFVLLLGSPIHSITVILSGLLIATGLGSMALPVLEKYFPTRIHLLASAAFALMVYAVATALLGTGYCDHFMAYDFWVRALVVALVIAPAGFLLGLFFPVGLQMINRGSQDAVAWAWGINGAFSVLGSIMSIILAQFSGFSAILLLGGVVYLAAILAFIRLEKSFSQPLGDSRPPA